MRWNCALIPDMGPSLNRIPLYALTVREEGRIGGARIILPDNNTHQQLRFNPFGKLCPNLHVSKGVFNIAPRCFEVTKLTPDSDS